MPDYLSIDWQSERISCVEGTATVAGAKIRHCFQLQWPDNINPAIDAAQAGQWLAEEFSRRGVRTRNVLVSLPRQEIMVRSLSVPNVADAQLPDLVQLQAETIAASSLDDQTLDFLSIPVPADATSRQVLIVTIANQKLDQIRQVVESTGLVLAQVGISAIATAELVARSKHQGGTGEHDMTLVVAQHEGRLEISLMRDNHLLFMHASQIASEKKRSSSRAAWAEIRRALGAASRIDAESSVAHAWLIGLGPDASLARMLEEQLSCAISLYDLKVDAPIKFACAAEAVDEGFYAGALGMLLAAGETVVESIDFLQPRRAPEQIDHGKRRRLAIACCTLVAVVLAYGVTHWRVAGLDVSIDAKQTDVTRMSTTIDAGQPLLKAASSVAAWENHVVDWLQFISAINDILPGTDRIYLSDCHFKILPVQSKTQVQATGHAKSRRDVEELYQRLATKDVQVRPHEINRTEDDGDYPFSFQLDVIAPLRLAPQSVQ
ncbi:MAG: pilus assembly protein PilM [Pirellulales bacterium]